jgi:hypothetical protein
MMRLDSVNDSPIEQICYIALQQKGYVNVRFFFSAGLPDPKKLLVGTGVRMRHVKIRSVEEAKNPARSKLLAPTCKEAPERVAAVHVRSKT